MKKLITTMMLVLAFSLVAESQAVTWTNLLSMNPNGSEITKTAPDGWDNAGASSLQSIPSENDGYFEFLLSSSTAGYIFGVSHEYNQVSTWSAQYSLFLSGTSFLVYEKDVLMYTGSIIAPNPSFVISYRITKSGDDLNFSYIYPGSSEVILFTINAPYLGDLTATAQWYTNGDKLDACNYSITSVPPTSSGDQDWLEVSSNAASQNIGDAIYTNGRAGINHPNLVDAMLYVNLPPSSGPFFIPGWNTILDVSQASQCRDNLLIQMGPECDWSTALAINNGPNRTATIFGNGNALVNGVWEWSDRKFKSKIEDINKPLEIISKLAGKTYEMRLTESDEPTKSIGFIAQDVQKIVPEMVRDFDGTLAVNYKNLIPILTEAIKDQQLQIESKNEQINVMQQSMDKLQNTMEIIQEELNSICNNGCEGLGNSRTSFDIKSSQNPWLGQNYPNPHNGKTSIEYYIPKTSASADLIVLDLQGKLISKIALDLNVQSIELDQNDLVSGMYVYALRVDNNVVDSKRMVIEK